MVIGAAVHRRQGPEQIDGELADNSFFQLCFELFVLLCVFWLVLSFVLCQFHLYVSLFLLKHIPTSFIQLRLHRRQAPLKTNNIYIQLIIIMIIVLVIQIMIIMMIVILIIIMHNSNILQIMILLLLLLIMIMILVIII